jgi:hypothetical protein
VTPEQSRAKAEADAARAAMKAERARREGKKLSKNRGRRKGDKGPDWSGVTSNPHNLTDQQRRIIQGWRPGDRPTGKP